MSITPKLNLAKYRSLDVDKLYEGVNPDSITFPGHPYLDPVYSGMVDEVAAQEEGNGPANRQNPEPENPADVYSFISPQLIETLRVTMHPERYTKSKDKQVLEGTEVPRWTNSGYTDGETWARQMVQAYKNNGITNPEFIRTMIAQDALESSWGASAQGSYNYGNITTGGSRYKGNYVVGRDHDADGNPITANFRAYKSMDEYVKDKMDQLTRNYDITQDDTADVIISKLTGNNKKGWRYAADKEYAQKMRDVYDSVLKRTK